MRIGVAGGSGCVGRLVVDEVRAVGRLPVVITRSAGVDITTGSGLDDALAGTSVLIDVSNVDTMRRSRSVAFFEAGTHNLLDAGGRAGLSHHVVLSIVGVERVGIGYYEGKRRQESLVLSGAVPASVLRATQFHEFAGQVLRRARGPLAVAVGAPAGMAPELAGPEQLELTQLARRVLRARRSRRVVVPVRLPGAAGRAMARGGLLPGGPGPRGRQTFGEWLAGPDGACAASGRVPAPGSGCP